MNDPKRRFGLLTVGLATMVGLFLVFGSDRSNDGPVRVGPGEKPDAESSSDVTNAGRSSRATARRSVDLPDLAEGSDAARGSAKAARAVRLGLLRCQEIEDYWRLSRELSVRISPVDLASVIAVPEDLEADLRDLWEEVILAAGERAAGGESFAKLLLPVPNLSLAVSEWVAGRLASATAVEVLSDRECFELALFLPVTTLTGVDARAATAPQAADGWSPIRLLGWSRARALQGSGEAEAILRAVLETDSLPSSLRSASDLEKEPQLPAGLRPRLIEALPVDFMGQRVAAMTARLTAGESSPLPFRPLMRDLVSASAELTPTRLRTEAFEASRHIEGMQNLGLACVLRDAESSPRPAESVLPILAEFNLYRTASALVSLPRESRIRWFYWLAALDPEGPHADFVLRLHESLCHRTERYAAARFVRRPKADELVRFDGLELLPTYLETGVETGAETGATGHAELPTLLLRRVLGQLRDSLAQLPRNTQVLVDFGQLPEAVSAADVDERLAARLTAIAAAVTSLYHLSVLEERAVRTLLLGPALERGYLSYLLVKVLEDLESRGLLGRHSDDLRALARGAKGPDVRATAIERVLSISNDPQATLGFLESVMSSLDPESVQAVLRSLPSLARSGLLTGEHRLRFVGSLLLHPQQEVRFNALLGLTDVLDSLEASETEIGQMVTQADACLEREQDEDVRYWLKRYRTQLLKITDRD